MTSSPIPLTVIQGGITRLRTKGGALRNSLFDLLNAYVTAGKTVFPRPGTTRIAQPSGTKGLTAFEDSFHVFSITPVSVPDGFTDHVLVDPNDSSSALAFIHFAAPYMGFLYVVAEFADGTIAHYWLQQSGEWTADTVYMNSDFVVPTTANGFAYAATRTEPPHTVWAPSISVAANDIVEPTVYNGYMFKAITVVGDAPHTGATEPVWPTVEAATVQEFGDFDVASGAALGSTAAVQTPGTSITDRYGNSGIFNANINAPVATAAPPTASASVSTWQRGSLYQPGAVVKPSTGQGAFVNAIPNGDFEDGDDGSWTLTNADVTITTNNPFQGTHAVQFALSHDTQFCRMTDAGVVTAGQSVTATAQLDPNNAGSNLSMWLELDWYDGSGTLISSTLSAQQEGVGYRAVTVTGSAPATAVGVRVAIKAATGTSPSEAFGDLVSWNLETPAAVSNFLFEAVQASVATSGTTEPAWPTIDGGTVTDGGVTWEAIGTSIITWQAIPIMKSGDTEPTFPTTVGGTVSDGSMAWTCSDRRVTDPNCPKSKIVAIGASKVFAADNDIIRFCATTNCLDWTSPNDAGFIPFGLQTYGSQPCAALGLYRSNLVAFNGLGYQMWQIDEDPANMALLDASPVGSTYFKGGAPVQNDYAFLTTVGIRSIGIAGASTNLQAGNFGKQVDPLVKAAAKTVTTDPRALFYPGTGQFMEFFDNQAFVLTLNGGTTDQSWSRYVFPDTITDWTVQDGLLYLRTAGDLVWLFDESALYDDMHSGGQTDFSGVMVWPFLDMGIIGVDKTLDGIDLVITGNVTINIGYDQADATKKTPDYVIDGDTLPGVGMIPFPMTAPSFQFSLTFDPGQAWEWEALNAYITQDAST